MLIFCNFYFKEISLELCNKRETFDDNAFISDIEEEEHSTDWIEGLAILLAVVRSFLILNTIY